ncbi:MAG: DNA alkylation repair protein [Candidatus Kariarchaeaceae archaeon]|jgi:3-methyladenine DNA glycosylase AlkD
MEWVDEIQTWLFNAENADQERNGKRKFLQTSMDGPVTQLDTVGISNGVLRKKAAELYKKHNNLPFDELITGMDELWSNSGISEAKVLVTYFLARYKKQFNRALWTQIDSKWIDGIDHWIPSDHLCMDVFGHFTVYHETYLKDIQQWNKSSNPWRRRISLVCLVKHVRKEKEAARVLIEQVEAVKKDTNYYVRKAIPWLLRESCKSDPDGVIVFIKNNIQYFKKTELREAMKKLPNTVQDEFLELYEQRN